MEKYPAILSIRSDLIGPGIVLPIETNSYLMCRNEDAREGVMQSNSG